MITVDGGNNILYLPLDRMGQSGAGAAAAPSEEVIRGVAESIVRELNERAAATRPRDSR
jgi:hypothetical protein